MKHLIKILFLLFCPVFLFSQNRSITTRTPMTFNDMGQVNASTIGILPNGSDMSARFQAAIDAGYNIYLDRRGSYVLNDSLNISNKEYFSMTGQGDSTVLYSTTKQRMLIITNSSGINLSNFKVESRSTDTVNRALALIYFYNNSTYTSQQNYIRRVTVKAPFANTNGIIFYADASGARFRDTYIEKCTFDSCGRFGLEVLNHYDVNASRYYNFHVNENTFRRWGTVHSASPARAAISFSGRGNDCQVYHNFLLDFEEQAGKPVNVGIENAGCDRMDISENFITSLHGGGIGILYSNDNHSDSIYTGHQTVSNNHIRLHSDIDSTTTYGLFLRNINYSTVEGNITQTDNYGVYLYGKSHDNYFTGIYRLNATTLGNACYVTDSAYNNIFACTFDASAENNANGYVVVASGSQVINNNFTNSVLYYKNNAQGVIFQTSGAAGNSQTILVQEGTYTPTVSNITNVASSSAGTFRYSRTGNQIRVSGHISVTPTATSALTVFYLTVPIDPGANFSDAFQAAGGGGGFNNSYMPYCQVNSNSAAKTLYCSYYSNPSSTGAQDITLNLTYYMQQ